MICVIIIKMGNATIKPKNINVLVEFSEPGESNIIVDTPTKTIIGIRPRVSNIFTIITAIFIILMI
jgi:hypothetical protein